MSSGRIVPYLSSQQEQPEPQLKSRWGGSGVPTPLGGTGIWGFPSPPGPAPPLGRVLRQKLYLLQHQPDILGLYRREFKQLLNSEKKKEKNRMC